MATGAPDYYKSTLLYGLHEGAPVPLACDEQGRLIFIMEQVSPFSKTGTVLLHDDFSAGLTLCAQWYEGSGPAGASIITDEAIDGVCACQILGYAANAYGRGIKYSVHPSSFTKLGVEWNVRWFSTVGTHWVRLAAYTGTKLYSAWFQYDWTYKRWRIFRGGADWQVVINNITYTAQAYDFHRFKLTINPATGKYSRLVYPNGELDLSEYDLIEADDTTPPGLQVTIEVHSVPGVQAQLYVDGVIITQDES